MDLRRRQLHPRRMLEQAAVYVWSALERAAGRPLARAVEPLEQLAQYVEAAGARIGLEALHRAGEQELGKHVQVLGEAAPGHLQGEVAGKLGVDAAFDQRHVQARYRVDGPFGQVDRVDLEVGVAAAQEVQRLHALGQLSQRQVHARRPGSVGGGHRELARLPDHEALEGAQHQVARGANALVRKAGQVPVPKGLRPVKLGQLVGLRPRLHLHQHAALPQQIGEPAGGVVVLEADVGVVAPSGAIAVEELGARLRRSAPRISRPPVAATSARRTQSGGRGSAGA